MNESEIKFAKRLNDHLEQYRGSVWIIVGEKIPFIFHILLDGETNEVVLEIDEWIRQGQGEDGQHFTPENSSSSSTHHGLERHRKEVKRDFCTTRKEMQLTSGSSSLETSGTCVQVLKRFGT